MSPIVERLNNTPHGAGHRRTIDGCHRNSDLEQIRTCITPTIDDQCELAGLHPHSPRVKKIPPQCCHLQFAQVRGLFVAEEKGNRTGLGRTYAHTLGILGGVFSFLTQSECRPMCQFIQFNGWFGIAKKIQINYF